jgi:hypothetical protein
MNGGLAQHPTVQAFQRGLDAQPVQGGYVPGFGQTYGNQQPPPPAEPEPDLSSPPPPAQAQPLRGSRPGEPQTMDDWVQALVKNGWEEETAIMLAGHKPDEPISVPLREQVVRDARPYFPSGEAMRDAFAATGFTPQPNLPKDVRPRPTGLQTLRFLSKIDRNPAATPAS